MSKIIEPISYESPFDGFAKESTDWNEKDRSKKEHIDRLIQHIKTQLKRKFNNTCFFCKESISQANSYFEIEHILTKSNPSYINFTFNPKNLALSCKVCNNLKSTQNVLCDEKATLNKIYSYDEYPSSKLDFKIIHPYFDDYDEHIKIDGIFYLVVNNSEKGKNTIKYYHLSRLSLAELKIKNNIKFNNKDIRDIMNINKEVSADSNSLFRLIDKKLNPNDASTINQNRIDKICRINSENFKDFENFRLLVDGLNKLTFKWFENDTEWYKKAEYIDTINNSMCFSNQERSKQIVLDNIQIVLDGLSAICATSQLRKSLENITINDVYFVVSEFRKFLNDESYNSNKQLLMIRPVNLAIKCFKYYNYDDFVKEIKDLIRDDCNIVKGMRKMLKSKKHIS